MKPAPSSALNASFIIAFAGLLLAFNAVSCDIMLPAFFAIDRDLGAGIEQVQAIVPLFLMSAAIGQLVFGPLSDAYGRRPVLMGGIAIYLLGTLVAGLAPSIGILYLGRVLQGLGAACGVVIARAILRDVFAGAELARSMALAMAIFAIGPFIAPMLGALLVEHFGWRGTFMGLACYGVLTCALTWVLLRETNTTRDANALSVTQLLSAFRRVVVHPQSRHFILVALLLQAAVASLVVNAPRIFASAFGIEGTAFALCFSAMACGVVAGQLTSHRAIARLGVLPTMRVAAVLTFADAVLVALFVGLGWISPFGLVAMLAIFSATFLTVMTIAMGLVIEPHRDIAGVASSVYGFLTQLIGSALALLLVPVLRGAIGPWSVSQAIFAALVLWAVLSWRPVRQAAEAT